MARKITNEDLANRGVMGLPDVPGLTAIEMQKKLEEITREVIIPRYNELVDSVADICDEFSKLNSYAVGDYCIYQNKLYKCNTATNGDWDASKWTETSVGDELKSVNSNLKEKITETILSESHHPYGGYEFERIGTICQVSLTSTNEILPNETVYLGTISNPKLLPNKNILHRVYSHNGGCLCLITIEKSGNVSIYTYGGNAGVTHNIEETFTYIPK